MKTCEKCKKEHWHFIGNAKTNHQWWCIDCMTPALSLYLDKTDELLSKNFTGKTRDMLRENHKKERFQLEKQFKKRK